MSTQFTAIDLSKLDPPKLVEALSYESIYQDMLADLQARMPDFDITLETEPAVILLQVAAYREFIIRQRVNDAARSVMVAYATGSDLDHLAAVFGVQRLTITPATTDGNGNPVAAVMEGDDAFRQRIVLAPESYSVAGPPGAYQFHALSADPDVLSAYPDSPSPGEVVITILSRTGDGTASPTLISTVQTHLESGDVRPLTDHVTVQSAAIVNYAVTASLKTYAGPDSATVMAAAQASIAKFVADNKVLGRDITLSGVYAALHVAGVQNVTLTAPTANVVIDPTEAAHCTAITLTFAGTDE